jgi:hypothetical protein
MTRETKAGLVVASSFLCLVGIVLVTKLHGADNPPSAAPETAAGNDSPRAKGKKARPSGKKKAVPKPKTAKKKAPDKPGKPDKKGDEDLILKGDPPANNSPPTKAAKGESTDPNPAAFSPGGGKSEKTNPAKESPDPLPDPAKEEKVPPKELNGKKAPEKSPSGEEGDEGKTGSGGNKKVPGPAKPEKKEPGAPGDVILEEEKPAEKSSRPGPKEKSSSPAELLPEEGAAKKAAPKKGADPDPTPAGPVASKDEGAAKKADKDELDNVLLPAKEQPEKTGPAKVKPVAADKDPKAPKRPKAPPRPDAEKTTETGTPSRMPAVGNPPKISTPPIQVAPGPNRSGASAPRVESSSTEPYQIKAGDTLEQISKGKYNSENYAKALLQYNRERVQPAPGLLRNPPVLEAGKSLQIPNLADLEKFYPQLIPNLQPQRVLGQPTVARPAAVLPVSASDAGPGGKTYRVKAGGERLWNIARTTLGKAERWGDIYRLNPQLSPELPVPAGTLLRLPPEARAPGKEPADGK